MVLLRFCAAGLLAALALECAAAPVAQGRHWRLAVDSIACEAVGSLVALGVRIDYLGSEGLVQAPIHRIVDAAGKPFPPRSLVWKSGRKQAAPWFVSGGIDRVPPGTVGELQFKLVSAWQMILGGLLLYS